MMDKNAILLICLIVAYILPVSVSAQDEPTPELVSVSGSFNYTPEIFVTAPGGDKVFYDASEDEVWSGDIEGTAVAPFRMVIAPDGVWDAWLVAEFEGTVLGQYEGTMVIASRYKRPAPGAHWAGEWIVINGTGDLEDVQGHGTAWGPGFNPADPEAGPDIYYSGELLIIETASEG